MGLKQRNDTTANWASVNPILEMGERGFDSTLKLWKTGNGVTAWNSLAFDASGDVVGPSSSVASEVVLFDGTTGKLVKRATGTGIPKLTSGVQSIAVAGDFPTFNQDTTGKSAKTDALNSASTVVNVAAATAPTVSQVLRATDSTHATWQSALSGLYGDGSDGSVNFDGTTATLSGVYTRSGSGAGAVYTLARDVYFTDMHVSNSCLVFTGNFRIFVNGTLTIDSGCVVHGDGTSGLLGGGGGSTGTLGRSGSGGNGGTTGVGAGGSVVANCLGGNGGSGGTGNAQAGGGTGTGAAVLTTSGMPRHLMQAVSQMLQGGSNTFNGGFGGGGGGGSATGTGTSGGGGAGGFPIGVYALVILNSGTIRSAGGAGQAATLGTAAGRGGGGGGGGGLVVVVSTSASNGTVTAPGGAGGNGAGTGAAGSSGSSGLVIWLTV